MIGSETPRAKAVRDLSRGKHPAAVAADLVKDGEFDDRVLAAEFVFYLETQIRAAFSALQLSWAGLFLPIALGGLFASAALALRTFDESAPVAGALACIFASALLLLYWTVFMLVQEALIGMRVVTRRRLYLS
jgi:hypothetical protein